MPNDRLNRDVFEIGSVDREKELPAGDVIWAFRKAKEAVHCGGGCVDCFYGNGAGPCVKVNAPMDTDHMKEMLNIVSRRLGTNVELRRPRTDTPVIRANFHPSNS